MEKKIAMLSSSVLLFATACTAETVDAFKQSAVDFGSHFMAGLNNSLNASLNRANLTSLNEQQQSIGVKPTLRVSSAQANEYNNATNAYNKSVVQGAVLGAVIGGVGCKFLADTNDTQTALCTAVGGVLGGLAGNEVDKKNKGLIADRESVVKEIAAAENNRSAARRVLAATEANIADLEKQVAALEIKRTNGRISEQQYQANMIEARKISIEMANGVSKVKNDIEQQKRAFANLKKQASSAQDINVKATAPDIQKSIDADDRLLKEETVETANKVNEFSQSFG